MRQFFQISSLNFRSFKYLTLLSNSPPDRLRLIILYLLFKDGLLEGDIKKLIFHSQLGKFDESVLRNFDLLGARVTKAIKDPIPNRNTAKKSRGNAADAEGYELSRFITGVKSMLEDHVKGTLDPTIFPFTKPELGQGPSDNNVSQASLRSAKPTWAKSRLSAVEPRQRVIVFMAGGATYSESRACYEISKSSLRDVFLGSSHMITPISWVDQVGNARVDRRKLDLPYDRPQKEVPRHLLEPDPVPKPTPPPVQQQAPKPPVQQARPVPSPQPPVAQMGAMKIKEYNPAGGGRYAPEEKKSKKRWFK